MYFFIFHIRYQSFTFRLNLFVIFPTVTSEDVCWSIRNVKLINQCFYNMRCLVMFVTAVCFLFQLTLSNCLLKISSCFSCLALSCCNQTMKCVYRYARCLHGVRPCKPEMKHTNILSLTHHSLLLQHLRRLFDTAQLLKVCFYIHFPTK